MDFKEFDRSNRKNKTGISYRCRETLRCISCAMLKCILPWEEEITKSDSKQKNAIKTGAFCFVLSFLLSLSVLDNKLSPFGLAIVCTSYGSFAAVSFCGAAVSCLFHGIDGLIGFICYLLVFLIRKSISKDNFNEKIIYRILTSFAASAVTGGCSLFIGQIDGRSVVAYFTYLILTILCVYLFSAVMSPKKSEYSPGFYLISLYAVCVCVIPSLNILSFSKIDFGIIFASFLTLWFSKAKGPVFGLVSGFLFGFSCMNPLYSAPLGLAGLVSGYIFTKSTVVSSLVFPFVSMFCHIYILDGKGLHVFLPFTFSASLAFLAVHRYLPDIFCHADFALIREEKHVPRRKGNEFDKVSDSLTGLSSIICKFAEHMKAPCSSETEKIIDKAFDEVCKSCSMSNFCYAKRECNFENARKTIISQLAVSPIKEEMFSSLLLNKCIKSSEICEIINKEYSELYFFTMKANRTQTVGGLYNSMSHLMKNTAERENNSKERDTRLEKTIGEALKEVGITHSFVRVYGKRCKEIHIHGIRADKIPCSAKELCGYLSHECKMRFTEPAFDISDSADMVMKFSRDAILSLEYAQCCEAKEDENVNGDTVNFFETPENYFYSVIADGMGSGKSAAATSRLSCVFLEKMLCAGTAKNICIEMLNNLLLSKNDEAFSGIDLLEIDKLTGIAYFIKAGAAPSFVLRKSRLYKISSETPPVGIIPAFSAESTRFTLERGDVIIMVSDGVVQSDSDAVWLSEVMGMYTQNEPALIASKLIEKSKSIDGRCDDASVCVVKIN